jgi:hypothetical protein
MKDDPSRYVSRIAGEKVQGTSTSTPARTRAPKGLMRRQGFARVSSDEIAILGVAFGPSVALLLEMIRLSGTRWVKRRGGWLSFDREARTTLGLTERSTCSKAVKRLCALGFMEVRGTPGSRLEYRLNPNWAETQSQDD